MDPEKLLLSLKELTTGPCPEPDEFISPLPVIFFKEFSER
jgi:hypothetical protein